MVNFTKGFLGKIPWQTVLEPHGSIYLYIQICVITKCVKKKGLHCIEYNFKIYLILVQLLQYAGLFPGISRKGPWPKLGKKDLLNFKIGGEINAIHM